MDTEDLFVVGKPHILNSELFLKRVQHILDSHYFTNNGYYVRSLEEKFSSIYGNKYTIAVCNATQGLEIALAYLKTRLPAGQILVPSFTFVATIHAITRAGFHPVFVDINEHYCMDTDDAIFKASGCQNLVGILPVNLFGNLCDYPRLYKEFPNTFILSDSAHALNICIEDPPTYVGNFGEIEVLSQHSTKLAGGFEGGLICTSHEVIADFCKKYRNFGFNFNTGPQGEVGGLGTNAKMDEVAAAAALTQLEVIEDIQDHYFQNFKQYQAQLPEWVKLNPSNVYFSNFSYVCVRVHSAIRDGLVNYLISHGIFARTYFQPVHTMKPYKDTWAVNLPNTERISKEMLTLPTGLTIGTLEVDKIVNKIKEFVQ